MEKKKAAAITIVFAVFIFGFAIAGICLPDKNISFTERRKLARMPEFSAEAVFSGDYAKDLEKYLLDQFPLRDKFRTVNAAARFYVLWQSDNDGIYIQDGGAFKMEASLDEKQVRMAVDKINYVYDTYLKGMNVCYAVVPDKNAFAADSARPHMDYDRLDEILAEGLKGIKKIDLNNILSIEDYYRTDPHWMQEAIYPAAVKLADGLGVSENMLPLNEYTPHKLENFYGAYYGQSALPLKADTLTYMTSAMTDSAVVTGTEFEGERPVYMADLFEGMDGYDVYLSGAQAVLVIEQPKADTDKELIIFRDSFGSSIAPYFIGAYSKITLIDLRYIPSSMLGDYIEFENQDVLFLYSTLVLNSGALLK